MGTYAYRVQPGDSLSLIAKNILQDSSRWQEIAYINSIAAPYTIHVGDSLRIPDDVPLDINIEKSPERAAPVAGKGILSSPATVALLVAGAALLLLELKS